MCQTWDQYSSNRPPSSVIQWHSNGSLTHTVPEEMLHGQYSHLPQFSFIQKGLKGSHPTGVDQHNKACDTKSVWRVDNRFPKSCGEGNQSRARNNRERRTAQSKLRPVQWFGQLLRSDTLGWASEQPAVSRHKIVTAHSPTCNISKFIRRRLLHSQFLWLYSQMNF